MWVLYGEREGSFVYHNWQGYYYHCNRVTRDTVYFNCTKRRAQCRGRAILYENGVFVEEHRHNHVRNFRKVRVNELRHSILQTARLNPTTSFREIVHREGRRFPFRIRSQVTVNRMRSALWRVRNENYPAMPQTMLELANILGDDNYSFLSKTENADDSIFRAVVEDMEGSCHIILLSRRMMPVMENCQWLFGDGHFASRPVRPPMSQIFNLATAWDYHGVYLGSILMESRTEEAYRACFETLVQIMPNLSPQFISCDHELAQQNAWAHVFPHSTLVGCLWHFCRSVIKKCFRIGLGFLLRNSRRVRRLVRMCCILPLLPKHLMYHGLFEVAVECQRSGHYVNSKMFPLLVYMEDEWIRNPYRCENMSVFGCKHRTNNILECINRFMRQEVGFHHPSTFALIEAMVRLEAIAMVRLSNLMEGGPRGALRRNSAVANDERIAALSRDLLEMPLGLRFAVRNFIFHASNTVRNAYNDLIRHDGALDQ